MTKTEQAHHKKVRQLTCAICNRIGWDTPCEEVHHILEGGRRIGEFAVLPLCREHHQGETGIHRSTYHWKFTELDLLNDTLARL